MIQKRWYKKNTWKQLIDTEVLLSNKILFDRKMTLLLFFVLKVVARVHLHKTLHMKYVPSSSYNFFKFRSLLT